MAELSAVTAGGTIDADTFGNPVIQRVVSRYATETARDSTTPSPNEGEVCYIEDINQLQVYNGSGWRLVPSMAVAADTLDLTLDGGVDVKQGDTGTASTPEYRFYSSGNSTRDAKISVSGGTSTAGDGTLNIEAKQIELEGQTIVVGNEDGAPRLVLHEDATSHYWRFTITAGGDLVIQYSTDGSSYTTKDTISNA